MSYAMFGLPHQVYDVGRKYLADADGKIADVSDLADRKALRDSGCLDEDPIVSVTSADGIGASSGASGTVQMSDGAGGFSASQITDNGTQVIIANGQIETPTATPLSLTTDTGITVGSVSVQGANTFNAAGLYANNLQITANGPTGPTTPASAAAAGVAGTVVWDSGFIYVCVATNTWKRVAIATW